MRPRTQWVTIRMNCHHTIDFENKHAPEPGTSTYCNRCGDYRTVEGIGHQITIRCNRCRYSRSFGRDELAALRAAGRHVVTRASHKVMVKDGARLVRVVTIGTAQLALGEHIRQSSVDSQSALRAFESRASRQRQDQPPKTVT